MAKYQENINTFPLKLLSKSKQEFYGEVSFLLWWIAMTKSDETRESRII